MKRTESVKKLKAAGDKPWDVVIIGGGATGLGIALDAASRNYSTLLLEQADFAKGTSSHWKQTQLQIFTATAKRYLLNTNENKMITV